MSAFEHRMRIYAEDTDFTGVVYHANYLKFAEHARTEWLQHLGIPLEKLGQEHYFFVVRHAEIDYLQASRMGDCLIITSKAVKARRTSMTIEHSIYRCSDLNTAIDDATCINRIRVVVVCINPKFRPTALPTTLKEAIDHES